MIQPTIQVFTRNVYGRSLTYIAQPIQAQAISVLMNGAKTLESRHLGALSILGFLIEEIPDPSRSSIGRCYDSHAIAYESQKLSSV